MSLSNGAKCHLEAYCQGEVLPSTRMGFSTDGTPPKQERTSITSPVLPGIRTIASEQEDESNLSDLDYIA